MRLVIQIPCYNEEKVLGVTVAGLPRDIPGVTDIRYLVIDDGSRDGTVEVARSAGVHRIVSLPQHRGLAAGFRLGIETALAMGADIIVNTDADNQYPGDEIPRLIEPILKGQADMVAGCRDTAANPEFSAAKKFFQWLGSGVVRRLSNTDIPDVTTGFRAYNREAALRLNVLSTFTYTLETIIQAGLGDLAIRWIPIRTNPKTRESRLFRSIPEYLLRSTLTILRVYVMYRPLRFFFLMGGTLFLAGALLGVRFLWDFMADGSGGHLQSLLLGAVFLIVGFLVGVMGVLADVVASNRRLIENVLYRLRRQSLDDRPSPRT